MTVVIGVVFLFLQNNKLKEWIYQFQSNLQKDQYQLQENFQKNMTENFDKLKNNVETKMKDVTEKVEQNLSTGLDKTTKTFQDVIQRLAKIDEAQKKIENLSQDVVSLQNVLTDKKTRGIMGEVQLNSILNSIFGDNNKNIFQTQHALSNSTIVDAVLFLPDPIGKLCIDSKFPLENFRKMMDSRQDQNLFNEYQRNFRRDLKKHIDDIASKYIITAETADQAVLFLPAEAIFAEIHAYFEDIVDYAHKNRVWLTSPTTLMATLSTVQIILHNKEQSKYAHVIQEELAKLAGEFDKYRDRWDKLSRHMDTVSKDVKDIHVTTGKITKRFGDISQVKFEETKDNRQKLPGQAPLNI
ncbi:MAG: DNA recombination protein RmuC [Halobacteriovoraceae bacterium]|nr:DNA recombination protein RmuC [Halobacteriovoraceae bacterium]